jgi:hypothetical protein
MLAPFVTSVLDGGDWSISCPGLLTCGERTPEWAKELVWAFLKKRKISGLFQESHHRL